MQAGEVSSVMTGLSSVTGLSVATISVSAGTSAWLTGSSVVASPADIEHAPISNRMASRANKRVTFFLFMKISLKGIFYLCGL
jgi:hypothetical protein